MGAKSQLKERGRGKASGGSERRFDKQRIARADERLAAIWTEGKDETMGTALREKMGRLPPERRARIEAGRLHAEYLTLKELREAKDLT